MSESKETEGTPKLIDILSLYYDMYKDCEKAYENANKNKVDLRSKLEPLIKKEKSDDEEFRKLAKEYLTINTVYSSEVSFAASRFVTTATIYLQVSEEGIPKRMEADYLSLKQVEYKPAYSVKNGNFIRNSKVKLPEIPDQQFEYILKFLEQEFKKS